MRTGLIAALLAMGLAAGIAAQSQPLLQLQGQPYFGGPMKLHLTGTVGQPALLAYGLNPLTTPIQTSKGPWFIGSMMNLIALGNIPTGGRIDLPFTMPPPMPALAGIPLVLQGYVPWQLSNPAILRLDTSYLSPQSSVVVTAPTPMPGAKFGDRVTTGDFDADGFMDLAVGAAYEDYLGLSASGRVYILWGPDWNAATVLSSPNPGELKFFGGGLASADVDLDQRDDLAVAELISDLGVPTDFATLYVFSGTSSRIFGPPQEVPTPFGGLSAGTFGRRMAAGDVTSDGWPDIVVGVGSAALGTQVFSGALMIVEGPALVNSWVIPNPTPVGSDFFGNCVTITDVDGDGHLDIVEGSGRADVFWQPSGLTIVNAGEVHVGRGPTFSSWLPLHSPAGLATDDRFGDVVTTLDTDHDGVAEIATTNDTNDGVVIRSDTGVLVAGVPKPPSFTSNPFGETAFGYAVGSLDANGDGEPDILIGDPFEGGLSGCSLGNSGTLYAALGPFYSTFHRMVEPSPQCGVEFSWVVERADMNSDGKQDLVVSSPGAKVQGIQSAGRVVVLFGGF